MDLITVQVKGRSILLAVYSNGTLRGWDLPSQKRVFMETLLAEALVESTTPVKIAAVVPSRASQDDTGRTATVSMLVSFAPTAVTSDAAYEHQVLPFPGNRDGDSIDAGIHN